MSRIYATIIFFITVMLIIGCSGGSAVPVTSPDNPEAPGERGAMNSERMLWGMWDIYFDPDKLEATAIPVRTAQPHWNITPMITPPACSDCVAIKVNFFEPEVRILDADVTLKNPGAVGAHDVRGILFTNDAGHELLNADDWTGLWDPPGGMVINPFKAYAKEEPSRYFSGSANHTEKFVLYIPKPPEWGAIRYAVDVSWPGNCKEPYTIECPAVVSLSPNQDSTNYIQIAVFDWQDDVSEVWLSAPDVMGASSWNFTHVGGPIWGIDLINLMAASTGEYTAIIEAKSANSGELALYDIFTILIQNGWARTWGGSTYDSCDGVATDNDGNIYATGYFEGTCDFDPGPELEEVTSIGYADIYLSKFSSNGDFLWVITWGGTENDYGNAVAVDTSGFIYVAGNFRGTVDFDPGPGTEEHISNGQPDNFLVRFDYDGNFSWAQTWGSTVHEYMWDVVVDNIGNVYTSGAYFEITDFDPGPGIDNHTPAGMSDAFLSKFSTDGTWQWARTWGNTSNDCANSMATDEPGNVYITGNFGVTVDFDPGPDVDSHATQGGLDAYISKFNTGGEFQWAKTWGGTSEDIGFGIASDSGSSVYATGHFAQTVDFDPGPAVDEIMSQGSFDEFLCKYSLDGDYQYAYAWGGLVEDYGIDVAVDTFGNVYVVGHFASEDVDFDPGPGAVVGGAPGGYQYAHLSKFSPAGDFVWADIWGSDSANDHPEKVMTDLFGNAFVCGYFMATADFDPWSGTDEHTPSGVLDACLSKFPPDGKW